MMTHILFVSIVLLGSPPDLKPTGEWPSLEQCLRVGEAGAIATQKFLPDYSVTFECKEKK